MVDGFINGEGEPASEKSYINTAQIVNISEDKEFDCFLFEMSNRILYYIEKDASWCLDDFMTAFSE